jgi:hypothetical protein
MEVFFPVSSRKHTEILVVLYNLEQLEFIDGDGVNVGGQLSAVFWESFKMNDPYLVTVI